MLLCIILYKWIIFSQRVSYCTCVACTSVQYQMIDGTYFPFWRQCCHPLIPFWLHFNLCLCQKFFITLHGNTCQRIPSNKITVRIVPNYMPFPSKKDMYVGWGTRRCVGTAMVTTQNETKRIRDQFSNLNSYKTNKRQKYIPNTTNYAHYHQINWH